MQVDV